MYGINSPQGFIAVNSENNAISTASELSLPISNGYANNLFTGDLIIWNFAGGDEIYNASTGYVASIGDYMQTALTTKTKCGSFPLLGVFTGCSYVSPTDTTNPYLPRRTWWPAGTQSVGTDQPTAYFIPVSYEYGFTVQCGAQAPVQSNVGWFTRVVVQYNADNTVAGDTLTGQSKMSVSMSDNGTYAPLGMSGVTPDTATDTFLIMGLDNGPNSEINGYGASVAYGNVIVRLCNTALPMVTNYNIPK